MNHSPRIDTEIRIVAKMIRLYCTKNHGTEELCPECETLRAETESCLTRCTYGESKPICKKCPIKCWSGDKREQIKRVMQFSGPRMIFHDPIVALVHLIHSFKSMKYVAIIIGWISLTLGIIGIAVPGLPTTPFVLLSAFLFSQSSPLFHRWLRNHKFFGELIQSWESSRSLPRKLKRKAIIIFLITIGISIAVIPMVHAKLLVTVVGVVMLVFLSRIPSK